ncbi:DUF1844 domain-containing protein [candidate division WOR-3 bacterium]|nr:DUF1844 domain-containing protein [candidate division WOR-3 bacterium]
MSNENSQNQTPEEIPATLSALILSIAATALHYLGRPLTGESTKTELNLPLARHTIDTLEMLKTKTEGNRSTEETELLNDLLYQLRLAYLQATQKPAENPENKT